MYDHCYECTGYGDDYYWDDESQEYVSACAYCPFNAEGEEPYKTRYEVGEEHPVAYEIKAEAKK